MKKKTYFFQPYPPIKPQEPTKIVRGFNAIYSNNLDEYSDLFLADIINKIPENKKEDAYLRIDDISSSDYGASVKIEIGYEDDVENKYYDQDVKRYKKDLKHYESKMEEYKENLKGWEEYKKDVKQKAEEDERKLYQKLKKKFEGK